MDRYVRVCTCTHWFQVYEKPGDVHSCGRLWQKIEAEVRGGKKLVHVLFLFVYVHNFYE